MDFYMTRYKRQYIDNNTGEWTDTAYTNQNILVIANSLEEAKEKISKLIKEVEDNVKYRAIPNGEVIKCRGLNLVHGYDSFYVLPIV